MKIIAERASVVRSAIRAGILTSPDPKRYCDNLDRFCLEEKVPEKNRLSVVQYARDLALVAKGGDPSDLSHELNEQDAKLEQEVQQAITRTQEDEFGFGFEDEPANPVGSPLTQAVRGVMDAWLAKKEFKVLWKPFRFEGQDYYLTSTWRMKAPGFVWNLTGTTGNNPVLHKCDENVLHFENESAVCANTDFELDWEIPKRFTKSALAGQKVHVEATVFVWLVKFIPNREFRFWLNEERDKPAKGQKTKEDIWTKRLDLKPSS